MVLLHFVLLCVSAINAQEISRNLQTNKNYNLRQTLNSPLVSPEKMAAPKNLNQVLKDLIANHVTLSDESTKTNRATLKNEIEIKLVNAMKKANGLFAELYQNIYYTGSFYDGLRIKEADEFDLNIRLKLPFGVKDFEIIHRRVPPGFLKYKLKDKLESIFAMNQKWETYKKLLDLLDKSGTYLSQQKVNRWLQSIVDTAMKSSPEDFRNFRRSTNGPATTLRVTGTNGKILDVDLVPVVELAELPKSIRPNCIPKTVPKKDKFAFLVPKSPAIDVDNTGTLWRVSLPAVERNLIDSKLCLKPLIKIFKAIRDKYVWSEIASYYIKTFFLYQVERHPEGDFWKEGRMGDLFKMMLNDFIDVMKENHLDHYFFKDANLLASVKPDRARSISRVLEKILEVANNNDLIKLTDYLVPTKALHISRGDVKTAHPVPPCEQVTEKKTANKGKGWSCSIQ